MIRGLIGKADLGLQLLPRVDCVKKQGTLVSCRILMVKNSTMVTGGYVFSSSGIDI